MFNKDDINETGLPNKKSGFSELKSSYTWLIHNITQY